MGKKKDKTATADLDDAVADVQYRIRSLRYRYTGRK